MYCRNCDYPLWNIPGRQCPECGDPFLPSAYEFKPGAVKFCCPDCSQQYYGTSYKGHLRPREFDCVQCGRHLDMDEMTLLPAEGWEERSVGAATAPWSRPGSGWFARWFGTVGWSYVNPRGLIAGIPTSSGVGGAWGFFLITQCLIGLIGIGLPTLVFVIIFGLAAPRGGPGAAGFGFSMLPAVFIISFTIFYAILWSLLIHATLVVTGGAAHSLGRTIASVFFASGTLAVQAIPCVGPYCLGYIVGIWWLVSTIIMVMESQKVSGLRASLAVLWFPVLALALGVSGYAFFIYSAVNAANMRQQMVMPQGMATNQSNDLADALVSLRNVSSVTPSSPVDVLRDSYDIRYEFAQLLLGGDVIRKSDLLMGDDAIDFSRRSGVPLDRRLEALRGFERPTAEEDPDRDAFTIGNIIYCLPDQPWVEGGDSQALWLMAAFDTLAGQVAKPDYVFTMWVIYLNGSSYHMYFDSREDFVGALDVQDEIRASRGLSPIKDMMLELYERQTNAP